MYHCHYCEAPFETPFRMVEDHGEPWDACPGCKGDDIVETRECRECDAAVDIGDLENGMCPACRSELLKRFRAMMDATFEPWEREALNNLLDGENLTA